ncbi:hypothetical protein ALC62_09123 [Cyphomyrmex costatus]|uniref:Uncharacterized protein n=1 Tax=Cyphomyrmex costatus TaxID=456900 RepID=A0A195CH48_9HYME|nr:hypothetical protein ALC62_09123 [Cyphomyrmex costatus]
MSIPLSFLIGSPPIDDEQSISSEVTNTSPRGSPVNHGENRVNRRSAEHDNLGTAGFALLDVHHGEVARSEFTHRTCVREKLGYDSHGSLLRSASGQLSVVCPKRREPFASQPASMKTGWHTVIDKAKVLPGSKTSPVSLL